MQARSGQADVFCRQLGQLAQPDKAIERTQRANCEAKPVSPLISLQPETHGNPEAEKRLQRFHHQVGDGDVQLWRVFWFGGYDALRLADSPSQQFDVALHTIETATLRARISQPCLKSQRRRVTRPYLTTAHHTITAK